MNNKKNILLLSILFVQITFAQINFKATVSKSKLGVNERLKLSFSINKQGADNFSAPDFINFKVIAGPFQSSNFSMINGKTSFQQTLTYTLQPKKKGTFTIPPATLTYKGKTIKSNDLKITVTDAIKVPKNPNDPNILAQNNIHLVVDVSNTSPYVGESINVIYKIYINRNKAGINNEVQSKPPTFNGFWNQNIEIKQLNERKGKYQDKEMSYYIIRKDVLIPQHTGKLTITPIEVDINGVVATNQIDFFGRARTKRINLTLKGGRKIINVKPLPEKGKPINFNGAVGDFNFEIKSNKTTVNANESAQIKVKLSGKGNLKLISLPKVEAPNGIELYEPEYKENIYTTLNGTKGTIEELYTIVPQFKGKFKIPSTSFSYFNPEEEKYYTINSKPIILNVPNGANLIAENSTKNNKSISDTDFNTIYTKTKLTDIAKKSVFFKSKLFYVLLILPLFSIPIGIYLGKKKREREEDIVGNRLRRANRLAKKYLSNAKKQLGNKESFYIALEKALHNYLKAKLHVETSDISKDKISKLLKKKQIESPLITKFIKVLSDCDFARYSPSTNAQMEKDYKNAINIISQLDQKLR